MLWSGSRDAEIATMYFRRLAVPMGVSGAEADDRQSERELEHASSSQAFTNRRNLPCMRCSWSVCR